MSAVDEASVPVRANPVSARAALALLVGINLFNYIDRQVLAAVEPPLRRELLADVAEADQRYWTGLLATAFLISYMVLAPLFGLLADRMSRWHLVGFGVILWSIASGASGLAGLEIGGVVWGYWALFATRCLVGVGEAAYGPVAPAMIADLFPIERRGRVMSWFYLAIPVGGALGYAVGSGIAKIWGWHVAFFCVMPPGLLLGAWCFFMRDPPRGLHDPAAANAPRPGLRQALQVLLIPSYLFNTLGMTMMTFALGGLAYWMADFLEIHKVQDIGPLDPVTFFGGLTALAGLLSTLAGGMVGDWLRPRFSGSYFLVSGAALILGFPMILAFLVTPFPWAWIFVFGAVFCLFFNTGPTNTILANVTHPSVRASAFAINILIIHLFGDAISPPLIGFIAGRWNLDTGFAVVSALMLVGGMFWLWGARYLARDEALAPTRL